MINMVRIRFRKLYSVFFDNVLLHNIDGEGKYIRSNMYCKSFKKFHKEFIPYEEYFIIKFINQYKNE